MTNRTITGILAKKDGPEKKSVAVFMPRKRTKLLDLDPEYISKRHIEKYTISAKKDGVFFATITIKESSSWILSRTNGLERYIHNVSNWPCYSENIETAKYFISKF